MPETLRDAETIFRAGLTRVDPLAMMERVLTLTGDVLHVATETECHVYDLSRYQRIFVLGMGKASARMALGLERVLGERVTGGVVAVKEGYLETLSRIRLLEAAHPVPDERGVAAAREVLALAREARQGDLVIVIGCGGVGGYSVQVASALGATVFRMLSPKPPAPVRAPRAAAPGRLAA